MEYTLLAVFLIVALFLLFSGATPPVSKSRKLSPPARSYSPRPATANTGSSNGAGTKNLTELTPSLEPAPLSIHSNGTGAQPRIVEGSDYLRRNRHSHLQSYKDGLEGEERVVARTRQVLDDRWVIFRNVDLGDKEGDIDVVLVGPGGIWAIEVKTYTGNIQVENGRWYKETRNGRMAKMQRGPGAQVRTNAVRLCNYLKQHGISTDNSVKPVVVMSGEALVDVASSGTAIWKLEDLEERLSGVRNLRRLTPERVRLIAGVLEHTMVHCVH